MKIQLLFIMLLISSKAYPLHRECSKTHARTGACVRHRVIAEESDIKVLHHKIDQINDKLKHLENKPHITLGRFKDKSRPHYSFEEFSEINISSRINILDIYESEFDQGKTNYNLLRSFEF